MGRLGNQLIPEAKPEPRLGKVALRQIGRSSDQLIPGAIQFNQRQSVAKNSLLPENCQLMTDHCKLSFL